MKKKEEKENRKKLERNKTYRDLGYGIITKY
jgi:hypothetical protein